MTVRIQSSALDRTSKRQPSTNDMGPATVKRSWYAWTAGDLVNPSEDLLARGLGTPDSFEHNDFPISTWRAQAPTDSRPTFTQHRKDGITTYWIVVLICFSWG